MRCFIAEAWTRTPSTTAAGRPPGRSTRPNEWTAAHGASTFVRPLGNGAVVEYRVNASGATYYVDTATLEHSWAAPPAAAAEVAAAAAVAAAAGLTATALCVHSEQV